MSLFVLAGNEPGRLAYDNASVVFLTSLSLLEIPGPLSNLMGPNSLVPYHAHLHITTSWWWQPHALSHGGSQDPQTHEGPLFGLWTNEQADVRGLDLPEHTWRLQQARRRCLPLTWEIIPPQLHIYEMRCKRALVCAVWLCTYRPLPATQLPFY